MYVQMTICKVSEAFFSVPESEKGISKNEAS